MLGSQGDPPLFSCGGFQAEGVRANLVVAWSLGWRLKASKAWVQIPVLSPPPDGMTLSIDLLMVASPGWKGSPLVPSWTVARVH